MKKIYIAGKISGECETQELLNRCFKKFNKYGLKIIYPPNGLIIPYTISGFGYSSYGDLNFIEHSEEKISFTHGLIINSKILGNGTWEQYMKNDIVVLITCDEIHMLPDWKQSKGATIEHDLANNLGIKIVYID